MKLHVVSSGWIENDGWNPAIGLREWPDDRTWELRPIGNEVRFVLNERVCIGPARHHPRYYHDPCPGRVGGVSQCDACSRADMSHVCERCDGTSCRIPELDYYCRRPHAVYLAAFSDRTFKVGTSYQRTFVNRVVEQGALAVCRLATVPDKFIAGQIEKEVSRAFGVPERISGRLKEKLLIEGPPGCLDEDAMHRGLLDFTERIRHDPPKPLADFVDQEPEFIRMSDFYDIGRLARARNRVSPFVTRPGELLSGRVAACIGSMCALETGGRLTLLNLGSLAGWVVDPEARGSFQSHLGD